MGEAYYRGYDEGQEAAQNGLDERGVSDFSLNLSRTYYSSLNDRDEFIMGFADGYYEWLPVDDFP